MLQGKFRDAQQIIMAMWGAGYAATDIIQTLFKALLSPLSLIPDLTLLLTLPYPNPR